MLRIIGMNDDRLRKYQVPTSNLSNMQNVLFPKKATFICKNWYRGAYFVPQDFVAEIRDSGGRRRFIIMKNEIVRNF